METQNAEDNEVQLVLRDSRVVANKDALARNSLYFAALFSANFKDHQQKEFEVNYDISLSTLQTFVNWAYNEAKDARFVHSSRYHFDVSAPLEKFINGNQSELLDLLNLSVIFAAERLTEHIADMIICTKLHPDFMLDVWLLAEDLELKNLRDVAFATCLDRFQELSLPCLLKLSKKNFVRFVLNENIHCSSDHMLFVLEAWKKNNGVINSSGTHCSESDKKNNAPSGYEVALQPDICLHKSSDEDLCNPIEIVTSDAERAEKIYDEIKPTFLPCIAGRSSDTSFFVWGWNGEKREFDQIAEMSNSQMHTTMVDNGKEIVGIQIIGRAFSIYLIGGEQGLGTGRFNTTLWRYCLFYKKWYIETVLPQPRRHMAVAFLKNKLYLFGGVGRHRVKLLSVDVYDIHTGLWSRAADIPEAFTEVPLSKVVNGKFIYEKSYTYIYDPRCDEWDKRTHEGVFSQDGINSAFENSLGSLELKESISRFNDPWLITFDSTDDGPYINIKYCPTLDNPTSTEPISFRTKLTSLPKDAFDYRLGSFDIIDPQKLYKSIPLDTFKLCSE